MILKKIVVGPIQANCYILADEQIRQAIIIDPGADTGKIANGLKADNLAAAIVVNTHGHFDHIGSDADFGVPIYIHKDDAGFLNDPDKNFSSYMGQPFQIDSSQVRIVKDKDIIELGKIRLEVIHTPGHTPGGTSLLLKTQKPWVIFTGDTLFQAGVGRTDIPDACEESLLNSIRDKILIFPDDTIIYPGHGPESSIGIERKENPFLAAFNF